MNTCLFARTVSGFEPAYVNLSQTPARGLVLTIRSKVEHGGHTACFDLDDATALGLAQEMHSAVSRKCNNG